MKYSESLFSPPQNFAGLHSPHSDFGTARAVILPVPYDSTTEWHSGARKGPKAIIEASQYLELYNLELDREIYRVGIHTLPQLHPVLSSPENMIKQVYEVSKSLLQANKFVVMLGGEHSLSLGMVQALKEIHRDLCVLQLDAHADLRDEYTATKYSHACVMRRIVELCPITQVGIRSLSAEENDFLKQNKMNPFYLMSSKPHAHSVQQIASSLGEKVYVTIDLDVLDPSIMSAVGTPEPNGMLWHEVTGLLKAITQQRHVVGFDIVELCPDQGPDSCAFLAAKLAYTFIGYATP
ncbi:MAG: agmatinase [Chloroflexi bacterium]|nr:agmatinase [Chloroflexota bacterium]MBM3172785.1 agmatinase [Chloroflexota bacterium]MBM3174501.1 agmatinase [Chloroflexota bacterium]MBM4449656.1 agmatinase [Chloroflexota bacterium]